MKGVYCQDTLYHSTRSGNILLKDSRMIKNKVVKSIVLLALVIMLVGNLSVSRAQDKKLSGELSVYLNVYYDTANNPTTAKITEGIVQKYMDAHPGVTIKLVDNLP